MAESSHGVEKIQAKCDEAGKVDSTIDEICQVKDIEKIMDKSNLSTHDIDVILEVKETENQACKRMDGSTMDVNGALKVDQEDANVKTRELTAIERLQNMTCYLENLNTVRNSLAEPTFSRVHK